MMIDRKKQIEDDNYYMGIAVAVEKGANCLGSQVGAVLVLENRVISTGYNGTPSGFPNCKDSGCVRCHDSWLLKQGRESEMSDRQHQSGQALDRCICVHAEQNALLTAARFGIQVDGSVLYTTQSPCFSCLKEAVQAGVVRVVYRNWYPARYNDALREQYAALANHLAASDPIRFEALGGGRPPYETEGQLDPYEDELCASGFEPPDLRP
jgi:dCMP deaminase